MAGSPRAEIEAALSAMEPAGREAFLSAVAEIRSPAQLALVAGNLTKGDIPRACIALALGPGILGPIDRAMRAAWTAGFLATLDAKKGRLRGCQ